MRANLSISRGQSYPALGALGRIRTLPGDPRNQSLSSPHVATFDATSVATLCSNLVSQITPFQRSLWINQQASFLEISVAFPDFSMRTENVVVSFLLLILGLISIRVFFTYCVYLVLPAVRNLLPIDLSGLGSRPNIPKVRVV